MLYRTANNVSQCFRLDRVGCKSSKLEPLFFVVDLRDDDLRDDDDFRDDDDDDDLRDDAIDFRDDDDDFLVCGGVFLVNELILFNTGIFNEKMVLDIMVVIIIT